MSQQDDAQRHIEEHRANIDAIDEQIVKLLNERATEALAIRTLKPQAQQGLYDPKREEEIFERLAKLNEGPLFSEDLRIIYGTILRVSKEMRS